MQHKKVSLETDLFLSGIWFLGCPQIRYEKLESWLNGTPPQHAFVVDFGLDRLVSGNLGGKLWRVSACSRKL